MRLIRFRRLDSSVWEIAFNEEHLYAKLNGEMAEIVMSPKPLLVRLWYRLFPPKSANEVET